MCNRSAKQVDLRAGDRLMVGDVEVDLLAKTGRTARLRVVAPSNARIRVVEQEKKPELAFAQSVSSIA